MTMLDAHLHLWRRSRGDYGWLNESAGSLWRDFAAEDAVAAMDGAGVADAILVQAAPTLAESFFLLDIASRHARLRGVVGWVDLAGGDVEATIARLRSSGPLVGIRPMLQDAADPEWILRDDVADGLAAVAAAGLVFDALVRPVHLDALSAAARAHPTLRIVVDHGGKPGIDAAPSSEWTSGIDRLAALPNVWCKLSGLMSEAKPEWRASAIKTVVAMLLERFGSTRLLWGSDWPVCTVTADYGQAMHAIAAPLRAWLSEAEVGCIFGDNARAIYGIGRGIA